MKFTLKILNGGSTAVIKDLRDYSDKVKETARESVRKWMEETTNDAQTYAPKKTGKLANSYDGRLSNSGMSADVESSVHYAPYVEFGTGTRVEIPRELAQYARRFKSPNDHNVNLPAQPHLFPNARRNFNFLLDDLQKAIDAETRRKS